MRNETKISKVWSPESIYGQTRQIISKTYREELKLTSVFDCSHIVLHLIKNKFKFMFAERNKNWQSLIPGSHIWTNSSNYLEILQRGLKIDCTFWLQSHCATFKKIEIDIYVYGMRPKFWKIDTGKPFMDKPVKLSRKLTERSENWLKFLIAVTLCYIQKNRN